jgi:glycosyltransferase involved in cell wall biosynthesis
MKVLSIGTDRKLFEDGSAVLQRQIEYAEKMEALHIIVFSLKNQSFKEKHVGNLHVYPTNSSGRTKYIFDGMRLAKKIVLENKFTNKNSVIFTQDPFETGLVGRFLKRKFNIPLKLQIHTDFLSPYFKSSLLNRIRVPIAKFVLKHADGVRVVSSVIAESLHKKFPSFKAKIEILPIFVDINSIMQTMPKENIKNKFPQFDFVVVMASRLAQEKRIDIALGALKKVVSQFPHTGLVIVGSGPENDRLGDWVRELGLLSNVVFVGWTDDVISYYKTADMFLLTSEYEGYGMTLIEAGASGCPIVTTRVGIAQTDLFKNGENSFVCPVGDVGCLAQSIIKLIHDPKQCILFKEGMQASIKSTSISREEYVEKYVGMLEALL